MPSNASAEASHGRELSGRGPSACKLVVGQDEGGGYTHNVCRVERKAHRRLCVTTSGLVISQHHPLIGCSPDAFVQCACTDHPDNRWLLEIKCPFTQRDKSPKEAALHCGCEMKDGELSLKVNHPYYTQVQGQLGITQRSRASQR